MSELMSLAKIGGGQKVTPQKSVLLTSPHLETMLHDFTLAGNGLINIFAIKM